MQYRKKKVSFLRKSIVDRACYFEGYNSIGESTRLNCCSIGRGTYIGRKNEFSRIKFGRFCSIGSFITNTTGNHPTQKFVSTHPAFFSKGQAAGFTFMTKTKFKEFNFAEEGYLVSIGNDVWVGDHVTILDGVRIGDGAIIGSNALVTKDIKPYTINVGVPAKPIRKRFTDEQIEFLSEFQWWNKDFKWITQNAELFDNIELLIKEYNEN
jgi:acetyltransferase-like isoleucine patch superfamily enzyme